MDAVVGGPVACFVVRVLETLQYLNRGRDITSHIIPPWVVVSGRKNFSKCQQFLPMGGREKVLAVTNRGHTHLSSRWCGPDLTFGAAAFREVPNSEVWVGRTGPIYGDGTCRM